jgi:hypothetical protein
MVTRYVYFIVNGYTLIPVEEVCYFLLVSKYIVVVRTVSTMDYYINTFPGCFWKSIMESMGITNV